ncbi:MAG: hypothetical protein M0Z27_10870 [Thermaerobacter sp.]|nr:hypothetical protein [Thermaerobacter sp.]
MGHKELDLGRAQIYAECVSLGIKPVAHLGNFAVDDAQLNALRNDLLNLALNLGIRYLEFPAPAGVACYFVRHAHQETVLRVWRRLQEQLEGLDVAPGDRQVFYHWVEGKLFGYSEEAIEDWVDARRVEDD